MENPRLLASVALFRELYDNNKDIYDVISEFIRAAVLLNSKWSFNTTECTQYLQQTFGFQIPEAVVKTCLKKRLVRTGEFKLNKGTYSVTDKFDRSKSIQTELNSTKVEYDEILRSLVEYVNTKTNIDVGEEELKSAFHAYLLDDKVLTELSGCISHFLIINQSQDGFKNKLNRIEEGLVLYTGIKYSSDPSKLGNWNNDITIFLDTEHLFSATGLNGVLYKQVFDDFNSLVKEANANKRKGGRITLRYFQETGNDVDNFFRAAQNIIENKTQVNPSKTAMISILDGCKSKSEIVFKKTLFLKDLNKIKINIEETKNYYKNPEYNIENQALIIILQNEFNHKIEGSRYADILKKFTKVNCLRKGKSNLGIERVSAIFMTENGLTKAVAFHKLVLPGEKEIPFATNIEFMTERLWFKLNKGFSSNENLPASFDIITKAKLVLSSQLKNKVSDIYGDLKVQHREGRISDEDAALILSELREKPSKPEDFTPEALDESINFITASSIENALREKSLLEKKAKDGEETAKKAVAKLKEYEYERRVDANEPHKRIARRQYRLIQVFTLIFMPLILCGLLIAAYSSSDTVLSIVFGLASAIGLITTIFKVKKINNYLWKLSTSYYKNHLKNKRTRAT